MSVRKSIVAKIDFIKEKREEILRAKMFSDKLVLTDEDKLLLKTLASEARERIKYSKTTVDIDIIRTLVNSFDSLEADKMRLSEPTAPAPVSADATEPSSQNEQAEDEPAFIVDNGTRNKKWLLSDKDFNDLVGVNNGDWQDWLLNLLWDNGITSPKDSYNRLHSARFEYSQEDCPSCGLVAKHYETGDTAYAEQWKCRSCRHNFSLTSGTYLDDTKLEYYHWCRFAFLVGDMKVTNSCTIAHDLGVTQKTAWQMLDVLRRARKELSDKKFTNGNAVLVFNHWHEVMDVLLARKKKVEIRHQNEDDAPVVQSLLPEPAAEPTPEPQPEAVQPIAEEEPVCVVSVKPDVFKMLAEQPKAKEKKEKEDASVALKPTEKSKQKKENEVEPSIKPIEIYKRNKVLDFLNINKQNP